jgi:flavin-dependent dehydrogenase
MFDAIVVGGRCAGAPTAMLLAQKGYRVLLVDRATFPSEVVSTHFLWPHGASYLNRWGLLTKVLQVTPAHTVVHLVHEGIALSGSVPLPLLRQYFQRLHGDDAGVVQQYCSVRRSILDQILIDAAGAAGVEVLQGFAVEGLLMDGERVVGIRGRTRSGAAVEEHARVVVGADGRSSFLARALKLPKYDERRKCTFAYWSYFSGLGLPAAHIHRRGRLGIAMVPTNHGQHMTLVFGPSEWGHAFRANLATNFQRVLDFVNPELGEQVRARGRREERFYGTLDQSAYLRPLLGPGWVLVGDAACGKDQCTATGMTHAFRDAELAAAALGAGLSAGGEVEEALTRLYQQRRRSQSAAAYYDYVCTLAEMRPPRHDELQLYVSLRSNQEETDRLIATFADVAPVADFFQASNLFLLSDTAKESAREHEVFARFEDAAPTYHQNLFA